MAKRRKKQRGGILITIGVLCVLGAIGLFCYNIWDGYRAEQASKDALEKYEQAREKQLEEKAETAEDVNIYEDREMPTIEIDGYRYVGVLSVPSENLELPVMEEWDYTRLKIAPCRYSGTVYMDNMIIAGHNYWRHFSRLKWIALGEKVKFTDVDGNEFEYVITNKETLRPAMVEELEEDKNDQWDLTLFTCNTGGQTRCIIRCERVDKKRKTS